MSSIIIWKNINGNTKEEIWAISDTRFSGMTTQNILTDFGPKMFEIILMCYSNSVGGRKPYHIQKIGFFTAGSATAALSTYSVANHIFSTLISASSNLPSMKDIDSILKIIAMEYRSPIVNNMPFEYAIIGYCNKNKQNEIYHHQIGMKGKMVSKKIFLSDIDDILLLGAYKEEIKQRIMKKKNLQMKKKGNPHLGDIPMKVLSNIIKRKKYKNIGGTLSLGILKDNDFNLQAMIEKSKDDAEKNITIGLFNHDILLKINQVGELCCGRPGIVFFDHFHDNDSL